MKLTLIERPLNTVQRKKMDLFSQNFSTPVKHRILWWPFPITSGSSYVTSGFCYSRYILLHFVVPRYEYISTTDWQNVAFEEQQTITSKCLTEIWKMCTFVEKLTTESRRRVNFFCRCRCLLHLHVPAKQPGKDGQIAALGRVLLLFPYLRCKVHCVWVLFQHFFGTVWFASIISSVGDIVLGMPKVNHKRLLDTVLGTLRENHKIVRHVRPGKTVGVYQTKCSEHAPILVRSEKRIKLDTLQEPTISLGTIVAAVAPGLCNVRQ